ncbi:S9 family peptidase [soil metagenome]
MLRFVTGCTSALFISASAAAAPDSLAVAFGAREGIISASISPDGSKISLIAAGSGRTSKLFILDAKEGTEPKAVLTTTGAPESMGSCDWVSNDRLACQVYGTTHYEGDIYNFSNVVGVDASGGHVKLLSQKRSSNSLWADFRGGGIVDLLPEENGAILMARSYVPEAKIGSLVEKKLEGLGIDRVDTRTGQISRVEMPKTMATSYISDGLGNIRIMGVQENVAEYSAKGTTKYFFRLKGSRDWLDLGTYDWSKKTGFLPVAVDPAKDVAYGFEKIDGRFAIVSASLGSTEKKEVIFAHPKVDVDDLIRIGRRKRTVGVSYVLEHREALYFDKGIASAVSALGKALGGRAVNVADTSLDENRMLVWAGSDLDPGNYYLFDRAAKKLSPVMPNRPLLANVTLSPMKAVTVKVADGTDMLAYLTLPAGKDPKGLPAIVMPHGGPESRDEWGFDWLAQYFAARGFAVIQPQFRGSAGFGDQWLMNNGFRSWRTSVGDVTDAGRWLIQNGIADPNKLTIAGWSYGGYAALQAGVLAPDLFKAIVAIAPVTDISDMLRRSRWSTTYALQRDFLGTGSQADAASPAQNAKSIRAPVLMFHGTEDVNVDISQSRIMQSKLEGAGKKSRLVVYQGLEHSLVDSDVRADLLQQAGDFLLAAGQ